MRQPHRDPEAGASLIEYLMLASLIAVVCMLALQLFGTNLSHSLSTSASSIVGG